MKVILVNDDGTQEEYTDFLLAGDNPDGESFSTAGNCDSNAMANFVAAFFTELKKVCSDSEFKGFIIKLLSEVYPAEVALALRMSQAGKDENEGVKQ